MKRYISPEIDVIYIEPEVSLLDDSNAEIKMSNEEVDNNLDAL